MFTEIINEIIKVAIPVSPIVAGLVQTIKKTKKVKSIYLPVLSVAIGLTLSLTFIGLNLFASAVGIVSGLMASGMYNAMKKDITK